jgi:enoyl-CoA hydratase/carnithine racemase
LIGIAKACELVFTGDIVDAGRLKELGLVNHVVPSSELEQFVLKMARRISQSPPAPIQLAKRALYQGMDTEFAAQLQFEALAIGVCAQTEDHSEALKAFLEKRKPLFKNR